MFSARGNFIWQEPTGPTTDPYWTSVTYLQNYENQLVFLDQSTNNFAITRTGDARPNLNTPFNGQSMQFNGTNQYCTIDANTAWQFGTGDFTVECWYNRTTTTAAGSIFGAWTGVTSTSAWLLTQGNSNTSAIRFGTSDGTTVTFVESSTCLYVGWQHVAVSRQGTTLRIFHNGTQVYSGTNNANVSNYPKLLVATATEPSTSYMSAGNLTDIRITKGTALYTSNFIVPTAPLISGTNTTVLINSTFTDIGPNAFTVTKINSPVTTYVGPYYISGGSISFDGTGDGIISSATTGQLVNTDFTWECWAYFNSTTGNPCLIAVSTGSTSRTLLYLDQTNGIRYAVARGTPDSVSIQQGSTSGWSTGTWYHIALVRSGNNYTIYRNGTSVATGTSTYSQSDLNAGITLGYSNASGSFLYMNGFISNARIVNGTAVYTANFTPPTAPLTAITNTRFLVTGTGQSMYNNTTFVDSGPNSAALTLWNTPYYSSLSPFGTSYPGSIFYNTTSALETSSTATMPSGTGAYTVECWIYLTALPANTSQGICTSYTAGGFYFGVGRSYNGDVNGLQIGRAYQADCENCAFTWSLNTWYHVAVVRSGTTIYFFVDGVQKTTVTPSSTASYNWPSSSGARFGGGGNATTRDALFKGYISNFRVTSSALYTSNFTPSTTPLGVSSSTRVLIGGSTGGFYELSNSGQTITNSATNANITSQLYKFGTQSGTFTATGHETVLNATSLQFGTGDFTLEGWVYRNAIGATHSIICKGATTPTGWLLQINSSNQLVWYSGSTALATSTTTIPATTWTYFAISRSGTTAYMFINGTLEGSSFTDNTDYNQTTNMFIGSDRSNLNGLNGYLDDIRITKGVCRYTASFTAPTSAFPTS